MSDGSFLVVGLGELLWDFLPAGPELGGAPANFAYIAGLLGDRGIVASRLGHDALGQQALQKLADLGLSTEYVQVDPVHSTGTVKVSVDAAGQPRFEIIQNVAWDFLEWTRQWQELSRRADVVCFGSLAQRSVTSRETIREFLGNTRKEAVRVFDVNLRQNFFSAEVLRESLDSADVVKLNHEELPRVMDLFKMQYEGERAAAARLREAFDLTLVCVTRAFRGSLLVSENGMDEHPGFRIKVADTVGAGDAFTAGLAHCYVRGKSLSEMNEAANRLGAWVASHAGATPTPGDRGLRAALAAIA